ncbi:MAG: glycosyltransferase family 2 protein, partial [Geodermatophilaceae bacterium]
MTSGHFPAVCSTSLRPLHRLALVLGLLFAVVLPVLGLGYSGVAYAATAANIPDVLSASVLAVDDPILPPAEQAPSDGPNRAPAGDPSRTEQDSAEDGIGAAEALGLTALALVSLVLGGVAMTTLAWMLHAWRSPQTLEATGFSRRPRAPRRSFSLLVPARHEEEVLGDTLDALSELDHPDYEVIAIIGHDDPGTEAVARAAADRHPDIVRVVIDHSVPKNKPRGLNTALPECRGDVVGVFDAEDEVHPELLRLVDARFVETGADVVQGGVQLMNLESSWWSLRNCMEYYFWFRSRLHFHANAKFIPLGGNTVFVRTDLLRAADGWDAECLAEDCELGVRLSTQGAKVVVAYDPEVVTREETPPTLLTLVVETA